MCVHICGAFLHAASKIATADMATGWTRSWTTVIFCDDPCKMFADCLCYKGLLWVLMPAYWLLSRYMTIQTI